MDPDPDNGKLTEDDQRPSSSHYSPAADCGSEPCPLTNDEPPQLSNPLNIDEVDTRPTSTKDHGFSPHAQTHSDGYGSKGEVSSTDDERRDGPSHCRQDTDNGVIESEVAPASSNSRASSQSGQAHRKSPDSPRPSSSRIDEVPPRKRYVFVEDYESETSGAASEIDSYWEHESESQDDKASDRSIPPLDGKSPQHGFFEGPRHHVPDFDEHQRRERVMAAFNDVSDRSDVLGMVRSISD